MDSLDKIIIDEKAMDKIKLDENFEFLSKGKKNFVFEYKGVALIFQKEKKGYSILGDARHYQKAIDALKKTIGYNKN